MVEAIYPVDEECVICSSLFSIMKARERSLVIVEQDSDFCAYYKDFNPYYYSIIVCPYCGYAVHDASLKLVNLQLINKIRNYLIEKKVAAIDLTGKRTWQQAVISYKLALHYALILEFPASALAPLYMRLAWLHREEKNMMEEKKFLVEAAKMWEVALQKEHFPINNMNQSTVEYLIGEIYRRLGMNSAAYKYLSKVVNFPTVEVNILKWAKEGLENLKSD